MVEVETENNLNATTSGQLQDRDVDRARLLIGIDTASNIREYIQSASIDNIRNFTIGCGSDNPLHCEPEYAKGTRWGTVIAPGMMAGVINTPMYGDELDPSLKAATENLFPGVHAFVSGAEWNWYRPIYPSDAIYSFSGEESLNVKSSSFGDRSIIRVHRTVKVNQRAEVVAVYRALQVLVQRKVAQTRGKYLDIKPTVYTEADIARIDAIYEGECIRGATKRYFEDVNVGDEVGTMAKGPLTVTDIICFHAGGYGFVPDSPSVGRLALKNRKRNALLYVNNEFGVPDITQRTHWEDKWAQAVGSPMAYDYGVMRENYLYHYLTDWCGDDGVVLCLHDEMRKFNYIGDTQIITGKVINKREENECSTVDVSVTFVNQRGEETLKSRCTIALPTRSKPMVFYSEVPKDLQERAALMMARHWGLAGRHS